MAGSPQALARLTLRHPRGVTRILAGREALAAAEAALAGWVEGRKLFVVTTARVADLHGEALASWTAAASRVEWLAVPEGEEAKTLPQAERLWRAMLASGGRRDSRVAAFGGGSVGDLAGFVAATFLRGVDLVQVPTTLLAQVDAAVGGKTAIDLPEGKNTVGVFHHPAWVVADSRWLGSLPREELQAGVVEAIKMGFLIDAELLAWIEEHLEGILAGEEPRLAPVIVRSIAAKVAVVERDPEELDERRLLNFGHTLGHALEAASGYRGLRHGEAVAHGMLFALRLAERHGMEGGDAARLRRLLGRLELPPLPSVDAEALLEAMGRDKKAREAGAAWVLPLGVGRGRIVEDLDRSEVAAELDAFLAAGTS